jgi:hypothetical protein
MVKLTIDEQNRLKNEANRLAKLARLGDKDPKKALKDLIRNNTFLAQLVQKLNRKLEIERAKRCSRKKKPHHLSGSIMTGLSGHTGSRPWKNTK